MVQAATWTVRKTNSTLVNHLVETLDIGVVLSTCLVNRGLADPEAARVFLEPRLADLNPLDDMADIQKAAARLADGVVGGEIIGVYGDYDADGVSSAALMTSVLNHLGARTETLFADRFEGYGLSEENIDNFVERGCGLIVTVDCGSSDHDAAAYAKKKKRDLIIVDHHRIEGAFPDAYAFVNPERKDCGFGDRSMAAVGVAFYVAAALRRELCKRRFISQGDFDLRKWLDLVALGTIADVMTLRGNNRILVKHGLRQMSQSPREGIRALMRAARIRSPEIRSNHVAFQLAPRLNAAGRLSRAEEAFDLLLSKDRELGERMASRLNQLSLARRELEEGVIKEAKIQVEKQGQGGGPILFVAGEGWHRGVLGIVAARLGEWRHSPVYAVGFDGDVGTGSARGQGQINLYESLACARENLIRFGGHRDAAGFTVHKSKVDALRKGLLDYAEANWMEIEAQDTVCDCVLKTTELTGALVQEIGCLGPFGAGNEEPIFEIDGLYVLDKRVVGKEHLKLHLKTPTGTISAFGPRMGQWMSEMPTLIRVAAGLGNDEWRGGGCPELRLVHPPLPGR